jgi:signal transduction histidine kinase
MRPFPHIGGRARERAVLVIGILSALLLASAALAPFSDPDLAGRAALSQLAGRVADGIVAEWSRIAKDLVRYAQPAGPTFAWDANTPETSFPDVRDISPAADGMSAFNTLLAEAERLEIQKHDAREALEVVLEALQKNLDAGQRAEARLRAIQLGVKADRADVVRDELAKSESELDGSAARKDTSYLLLCSLAANAKLDDAARNATCGKILELWSNGHLALPRDLIRLDNAPTPWIMHVDPRYEALRRSLASLCPAPESARLLDAEYETRKVRALNQHLWPLPGRPSDAAWQEIPLQDAVFGWHATARGTEGCYFRIEDLGKALVDAARAHDLLPSGFRIDFTGNDESSGTLVRGRTELLGSEFGFTLRHSDPESVVKSSGRRLWMLRGALFLLAAFALAAAFATWRAMKRDRHLSELRSAFVANVSHELRTPLASILLMAENLETGRVTSAETSQRYHQSMRREANRLRRLVDDVLDFSRIERGKPIGARLEDTALAPWAEDLRVDALAWAERSGAKLAFECGAARRSNSIERAPQPEIGSIDRGALLESSSIVRGSLSESASTNPGSSPERASIDCGSLPESASIDGEALRRAIFNLLDNALRHSGSLEIGLSIRSDERSLVIAVSDHGRGIPVRARSAIFEPFACLDDGHDGAPGTGLGLAIVREIAAAHGGSVRVHDPVEGSGAVFEIRIPLIAPTSVDV